MQLTEHFTLAEMTISQTAARKGIRNVPGDREVRALRTLCERVLEPVRARFRSPVVISSGYRSPRLNVAIGGSASSQHCFGEAADFTVPGISNLAVSQWMEQHLVYDQVIYEFGESGWIHCSYREDRLRNMELSAVRRSGRVQYLQGLRA